MWIGDCVKGIYKIVNEPKLIATPINLGSSELISINDLVSMVEDIAGVKLKRKYILDAPKGVAGRNSDNTFIKKILKWEPNTPLRTGMEKTYKWIREQFEKRQKGERIIN
jgi:nucleoside-diphosphate-sugar epimerase